MADGWAKVWWVKPDLDVKRFVVMPRTRNPKTSVAIAVGTALGWPAVAAAVPEHIKPAMHSEESALKQAVINRVTAQVGEMVERAYRVTGWR